MGAYVLRFQEQTLGVPGTGVVCGTATATNIDSERADTDPTNANDLFETPSVFSGTATVTKIRAEESDRDPHLAAFHVIPKSPPEITMSTQTLTLIAAESADRDVNVAGYDLFDNAFHTDKC
jgi:hypothetical protein